MNISCQESLVPLRVQRCHVRPKKINTGVTFLEAVIQRYGAATPATEAGGVADDAAEEMFVSGEDSRITKVC